MRLRVALIDPYLGGSHRAWAEGFAGRSRHRVTIIGHEARFWKWRMRGAHVTLGQRFEELGGVAAFDVVVATGMLDLAAFVGLVRGGHIPTVLYLHESQLTYPPPPGESADETYAMVNWVSALAAGEVWFNSEHHRTVFFDTVPKLLRRFPDHRHGRLVDGVAAKSRVVPVGVDLSGIAPAPAGVGRPRLLWNHRWEHDKAPEVFVEVVDRLVARGVDVSLILAGERLGDSSGALADMRSRHGERIAVDDHLESAEYRRVLATCDVAVSTSRQEFFGVSLTEAMAAGVFPVVPDRLVYPERIPSEFHDRCLWRDVDGAVERIEWALGHDEERRVITATLADVARTFDWSVLAPRYDDDLEAFVGSRSAGRDEPSPQ